MKRLNSVLLASALLLVVVSLASALYVIIPDNTAVLPTDRVLPLLYIGGGALSGQNATLNLYRQRQNEGDELVMESEVLVPGASGYVPWVIPANATQSCSYYVCLNPVNTSIVHSSSDCYSVGGFYCTYNPELVNENGGPRRPYLTLDYPQQYTKWFTGKNYTVVYSQFFGDGVENGAQGSISVSISLWKNNGQMADTQIEGSNNSYILDKSRPFGELSFEVPESEDIQYGNMYYLCAELISNEAGVDPKSNNQTNQPDEGICFAKSGMFSLSPGSMNITAPLENDQWQFNTTQFLEFSEDFKFDQFSVSVFQIRDENREFVVDDVRLINVNQQAAEPPRSGKIPFVIMWGGALQTTPGCSYFICINPVFVGPFNVRCLVRSDVFCISGGQEQPLPMPQQQFQPGQQQGGQMPPQQQGGQQQQPPQQQFQPGQQQDGQMPPQQQQQQQGGQMPPQQQQQPPQGQMPPPQGQMPPPQQFKRSLMGNVAPNNAPVFYMPHIPSNHHIPIRQRALYYGQHPAQYYPYHLNYQPQRNVPY